MAEKMFRKYEIIIESTKDEKVNLQRFLFESHKIATQLFPHYKMTRLEDLIGSSDAS